MSIDSASAADLQHFLHQKILNQDQLNIEWEDWFNDLDLSREENLTAISGLVQEGTALHRNLKKIRDLNPKIVSTNTDAS